jgi:hypothetical protein
LPFVFLVRATGGSPCIHYSLFTFLCASVIRSKFDKWLEIRRAEKKQWNASRYGTRRRNFSFFFGIARLYNGNFTDVEMAGADFRGVEKASQLPAYKKVIIGGQGTSFLRQKIRKADLGEKGQYFEILITHGDSRCCMRFKTAVCLSIRPGNFQAGFGPASHEAAQSGQDKENEIARKNGMRNGDPWTLRFQFFRCNEKESAACVNADGAFTAALSSPVNSSC